MKYIRLLFNAGSAIHENASSADFNKTNSSVVSEADDLEDEEDDDDDAIEEIDLDKETDEDVVETDDLELDDEDLEDDDDEDDDDVVSENKEKKSGIREALQQWSNDNARDIEEDDSTPLRSNL